MTILHRFLCAFRQHRQQQEKSPWTPELTEKIEETKEEFSVLLKSFDRSKTTEHQILEAFNGLTRTLRSVGLVPEKATVDYVTAVLLALVVEGSVAPQCNEDSELERCYNLFYFEIGRNFGEPGPFVNLDIPEFNDKLRVEGLPYRLNDNKSYPLMETTVPDFIRTELWRLK